MAQVQRCVVKGMFGGIVAVRNVFTAEISDEGVDLFPSLWSAYLTSVYNPILDTLSLGFQTSTYELSSPVAGHWVPFDEVTFVTAGNGTGQTLPYSVALVILGKAAGLRHVGRKFFGPITEGSSGGNALVPELASAVAGCVLAYITPLTGSGSKTLTPGVVDSGGTFHAFVGGVASSLLGSMRRRKPGNGI
jgi:hypothetical protein